MNARMKLISTASTALLLAGCLANTDTEFVYQTKTDELFPEAQDGFEQPAGEDSEGEGDADGDEKVWGLKDYLIDLFGTPNELVAWKRLPVDYGAAGNNLTQGRQLYMEHCMHCHGVSGDGNGPTARYLNPLPRDYRKGLFKFTSTLASDKPNRDDLKRTIKQGIPGTYMPSFMLLTDTELHAVTEYVRWLALRGELELKLDTELSDFSNSEAAQQSREDDIEAAEEALETAEEDAANKPGDPALKAAVAAKEEALERAEKAEENLEKDVRQFLLSQGDFEEDGLREKVDENADFIVGRWARVTDGQNRIVPSAPRTPSSPASINRGRKLFLDNEIKCLECHGDTGQGNGPQTRSYAEGADKPGLFDEWGHPQKPRNLTTGIYRGGRRPIDIYRRIRGGIKGTKMPGNTKLKDEQVWDLVNYVLSIPLNDGATVKQNEGSAVTQNKHDHDHDHDHDHENKQADASG